MGLIDNVTRDYLEDADIFADAFNYLLYRGKHVIKPEHLTALQTVRLVKKKGEKSLKYIERTRDLLKGAVIQQSADSTYLILGIESQSYVDYGMPVRNMLMNAMEYNAQIDNLRAIYQYTKELSDDEFLSGMKKDDKLKPVITLVIFFSGKRWDGARKLSDLIEDMDENKRQFFHDYEITIIEPAVMEDEEFDKFDSNLKEVLKFMKYSQDKQKMGELLQSDEEYKRLTVKAAQVINTCAKLGIEIEEGMEAVDMCQAWDDQKKDGIIEGRIEGRREGRQQGRREGIVGIIKMAINYGGDKEFVIKSLLDNMSGMTVEEAEREYEQYMIANINHS